MTGKKQSLLGQLATALVCLVVLIAFLISGIRLFGFQVYGVLSGSMEPTYPTGSLIYVRKVNPEDLQLRDVITFQVSGSTIATHRIVEIVTDANNPALRSFRTQGDANDSPDANLVSPGSIIGKVSFCIPHMGNLASYIQSPGGIVVTIILCLALVVFVFYTDTLDKNSRHSAGRRRRAVHSGNPLQRSIRQSAPSSAKSSGARNRQSDWGYMPQRDYPQRPSRQPNGQQGYRQTGASQQSRTRPYNDRQGYSYPDDYRSGNSVYEHPRQSTAQRPYSQQGYERYGREQARQPHQQYQQRYSQGYQQGRLQQNARFPSERPYQAGAQPRTNPHPRPYGEERRNGQ